MKILPREYQESIAKSAIANGDTLIVLPTGTGKTLIGALIIEHFLKQGKKCMFLAPTRPLVFQHEKRLKEFFYDSGYKIVPVTGQIRKSERNEFYKNADVIVATPQTIKNDLDNENADETESGSNQTFLSNFSCIIIDECHRAVGQYAYTRVAEAAKKQDEKGNKILLIGLTASPGGNIEKIQEIMKALSIDNVEIRTESDKDLAKYVQKIEVKWIEVELNQEIKSAISLLEELMDEKIKTLNELNITVSKKMPKGRLSQIYRNLIEQKYLAALAHFAVFYNAYHGIELLESEGPFAFVKFVERLKERKNRVDWRFSQAANKVRNTEHPKMEKLMELIKERENKKIIIFAQYRDQVNHIVEILNQNGFSAKAFLGKGKGGVAAQKMQKETLQEFAEEKVQILVASSIGEEGIDIPAADVAIFYEPVPSEIRMIQRRGRVGRAKEGEVLILMAKGTRDETFKYVSRARERKMKKIIKSMAEKKKGKKNDQKTLDREESEYKKGQEKQKKLKQITLFDLLDEI